MPPNFSKTTIRYLEQGDAVEHDITNEPIQDLETNLDELVTYTDDLYDQAADLSKDLIGFESRSTTTLTFDDTTRTVGIQPTNTDFSFYYFGRTRVSTGMSFTFNDTSGGRYIVYDDSTDSLYDGGAHPGFANVLVHYIYWNSSQQKFVISGDERHGVSRDTTWHQSKHIEDGTVWRDGGGITYTESDATSIDISLGTPITIADEDLVHEISHSATPSNPYEQNLESTAEIPVIYVDGNGYYAIDDAITEPYKMGTSQVAYNDISGGLGSQTDVPDGKYVNYYIVATNCTVTPIKSIQGRNVYDTVDEAQGEEIQGYGINLAELTPMYRITLLVNTTITDNTYKVTIESVDIPQKNLSSSTATISADLHNSLAGRSEANAHPASSISVDNVSSYPSAGNVEEVLDALGSASSYEYTEIEDDYIATTIALG